MDLKTIITSGIESWIDHLFDMTAEDIAFIYGAILLAVIVLILLIRWVE